MDRRSRLVFLILIFVFGIIFVCGSTYRRNIALQQFTNGWIDPDLYKKEIASMMKHRNAIIKELKRVMPTRDWSLWGDNYNKTPQFTSMTHKDIKDSLIKKKEKLSDSQSWKLYGLILNTEVLPTSRQCPNTMNILSQFQDEIVNAGFSCLEPGATTKRHRDVDSSFYRCHIPLIIPKGDCYLEVEGVKRKWDNPLVFDDTKYHNAWNNTDEYRVILIVDFLRR